MTMNEICAIVVLHIYRDSAIGTAVNSAEQWKGGKQVCKTDFVCMRVCRCKSRCFFFKIFANPPFAYAFAHTHDQICTGVAAREDLDSMFQQFFQTQVRTITWMMMMRMIICLFVE